MPEPVLSSTQSLNEDTDSIFTTKMKKSGEEMELKPVVVVGRSRSHATTRRVSPTTTRVVVVTATSSPAATEKELPNGDLFIGSLSRNVPHGSGKYLWTDGCMFEGDWKRGKASGKGKFCWPSGASFEGEFKSGRMEGFGTLTGSDGDTYRGSWSSDRKSGYGEKRYSNGDRYEGAWRRNVQEGQGRYVWKNGNEYAGEWRNGVINGRGILIWANGNRHDGNWENGVPKGNGVFKWPDGSSYVGHWGKDIDFNFQEPFQPHQILNGTFYPGHGGSKLSAPLMEVSTAQKRSSVDGERIFPRICIWDTDGEAGDITCDILDNLEASMLYRDSTLMNQEFRRTPRCFNGGQVKKPGQMISKGHRNYEMMLDLQLGIRHTVGKDATISDLRQSDFDPKEKFWTRFPPEGSKHTPPHQSGEFRWKDYCPAVFRHLRELFEVDPANYMLAICGNDALRELSSPGKSGSFFYVTQDDRFMIKTVKKSEVKVLIRMLSSYYQHVCRYENSLVTKFFGVHCIKPVGGLKTRFIVIGNLFCSEYRIHRRFDLKGSSYGRTTDKPEGEIDENTTLKDLDLNYVFHLQPNRFQELIRQIERDCQFLEAEKIMDYSLLVGMHFRDDNNGDKMGNYDLYQTKKSMRGRRFLEAELQDMDRILASRKPLMKLGANLPARAERTCRTSDFNGGFNHSRPSKSSESLEVVLYFGIIDILQGYDMGKKLEHAYKSWQADSASISAVDPKLYSKRFRDFISKIFVQDT